MKIFYAPVFVKRLKKLELYIQDMAVKKEIIFRKDPLHPSLRMHSLKGSLRGFWSITINHSYRIIFKRKNNGDIIFYSIGKHDIYKSL